MAGSERNRPDLSIIFGTYNRLNALRDTLEFARRSAYPLSVEFIIADGGSTDGSIEFLRNEPDVILIEQGGLFGACQAMNECAKLARADFVCNLNDDALCMDDCLSKACEYLRNHPDVGQVALAFRDVDKVNRDKRYRTGMILDRYYANFGIIRKWLGDYVGWFGQGYLTYQCDQELSFQVWNQGYEVVFLGGCRVNHLRIQDKLRETWKHDHAEPKLFLSRWKDKVKNFPTSPVIWEKDVQSAS